jgi:glycosyltransferase involved in cell wall biosynthesis
MENPKWTIGIVNWKSIEFIEYQLKYFHSFSDDFEFLVCDNESDIETPKFKELKEKYPKLKLINRYWRHPSWTAHGIGLNECTKIASGKYILIMDPDFFWMKKDILSFFEHYFDQGYHAVGADYMYMRTSFPMIWGAAYITDEIKDLDLMTKNPPCKPCKSWIHDRDYDTGWQIRIRLSNKPYYSFRQIQNQVPNLGKYNNGQSETYVYDTKVIAHHLRSGSQIEADYNEEQVKEIVGRYIEWMWNQLYD